MDKLFCFIVFLIIWLVAYFGLMAIFLLVSRALKVTDKSAKISYNTIWIVILVIFILSISLCYDNMGYGLRCIGR